MAGEHLLRTLQRLHAELAEHVLDEGEPPEDGIAACVQLGLGGLGPGPGPGRSRSCAVRAVEPMLFSSIYFGIWLLGDLRLLKEAPGVMIGEGRLELELGLRARGGVGLDQACS